MVLWCERPRRWLALAAGVSLGLGLLIRPTTQWLWLAELPVLYLGLRGVGTRWEFVRHAGLLLGGCLLAVAPWLLRNQALYGEMFLSRGIGIRLWAAVFSQAGAELDLPPGEATDRLSDCNWRHEWTVAGRLEEQGLGELDRDRWMRQVALDAIRLQPQRYAASAGRNWLAHWFTVEEAIPWISRFHPEVSAQEFDGQKVWAWPALEEPLRPLLRFSYRYSRLLAGVSAVVALAGAGLMTWRGSNRLAGLALLLTMLYLATVTAFVIVPLFRFRAIAEALQITAAVAGCYCAWNAVSRRWSTARDCKRTEEPTLSLSDANPRDLSV